MTGWAVEHRRGSRWAIVNRTGQPALDVTMAARGVLVIGGKRDWTYVAQQVADGEGPEVNGRSGMGRAVDPPRISVSWTHPGSGTVQLTTLDWPG